jgi:hypothetical protein
MYVNKGFLFEVEKARKIALRLSNPERRLETFFLNLEQKVCIYQISKLKGNMFKGYLNFFFLNEEDR